MNYVDQYPIIGYLTFRLGLKSPANKVISEGNVMKLFVVAAGALFISSPILAQQYQPTSSDQAASAQPQLILPANTEIVLRMSDDLTSKGGKIDAGHMFRLTVAYDVGVQGTIVIPSGTPAVGEVTMRTGKGVFGKSGKIEAELRHVDLNGRRIPVTGKFRQEGEGNTLAAVGAIFLSAPLLFVTGKSAVIPRGRELTGYTVAAETISAN